MDPKEFSKRSRQEQLAILARIRPGADTDDPDEQDRQLLAYVKFFFGMSFPMQCHPECQGKCTAPGRVLCDAFYARYPLIICKASRSAGKSAILTTLAMAEIVALATKVDILGASEKQSQIIQEYMNADNPMTAGCWWDCVNAPRALRDPANDLKSKQVLTNGGWLEALTASQKTVRGRRPTRLRIDELDEGDVELIKAACGCPKTDHANKIKKNILMVSTHQHVNGTFSYYWNMARERNEAESIKQGKPTIVIPTYQYCYKDVLVSNGGFLSDEEIAETKAITPEDMWIAEYENGEPNSKGRIFKSWQLDFLFDRDLGVFNGAEGEPVEISLEQFRSSSTLEEVGHVRRYRSSRDVRGALEFYYGADFANDLDWSIFTGLVWNNLKPTEPCVLYKWFRTGRRDTWREIIHDYNDFCNEHEGIGFHDETGNRGVNDHIDCQSEGFTFSRTTKKPLLDDLVLAIQNRSIKGPFISWAYDEFLMLTQEHLSGKKHLPDSVASLALAWKAFKDNAVGFQDAAGSKIPMGFVGY